MNFNSRGLKPATQSILLKTSAATDLKYSGSELTITGAKRKINVNRIVSIKQEKYRAEVVQVVTVGDNSYTPQASTVYSIKIGDPTRRNAGGNEALLPYSYTTPSDLTTLGATAALQREAIHGEIVTAINANPLNYVVAASLGAGAGFTVTDDAGYYPAHGSSSNNRNGKSQVVANGNSDGSGYTSAQVTVSTAAVYAFGVGATLLAWAPVSNAMTGNLTSGGFLAPVAADGTYAVSGQNYDAFRIETLELQSAHNVTGQWALVPQETLVFVDNGTGTATTNLAGFKAFEKEFHKLIANYYSTDTATVAEFFDQDFVIQGLLGAAPAITTSVLNKFITPYGMLNHINVGTQTIVAPTQGLTGLLIDQDINTGDGAQYVPYIGTSSSKQFVVGKTAFMAIFNYTAADVTGVNSLFGFRKKEAFQVDYNNYNDLAAIGSTSTSGKFSTNAILANAATVTTTSATTGAANTVRSQYIVKVAIDGTVTAYANGVSYPIYSAGTTAMVFAAGTVLVPFAQTTQITGTASVGVIDEFLAVNSDSAIII